MAEYIEREALLQTIQKDQWIGAQGKDYALCDIAEQPTADVVEVRHGYWFITEYEYFTCSECGNSYYNGCESTAEAKQRMKDGFYDNYCGHCGAKMDGNLTEKENEPNEC